jgi:hypothetical protein
VKIPAEDYLNFALLLNEKEKILINEFGDWLPQKIVDCHVHANTKAQCINIDRYFMMRSLTTFPWFRVSDHKKVNNIFYPKNKIKMLLTPFPYKGIDHKNANSYIVSESQHDHTVLPVLCGIPNDPKYTIDSLKSGSFYGLKMYPAYEYPFAKKISDFFPDNILRFWNFCNGAIILHIPTNIIAGLNDIISTAKRFPKLKIVLAHMGNVQFLERNINSAFKKLSSFENIFLDTSFVTSKDTLSLGLDIFGHTRILFGTDQPLNLIRARFYRNPKYGVRLVTNYPYHWINRQEQKKFSSLTTNLTHIHWEMLVSLREAIKDYGDTNRVKSCVFSENAEKVFNVSQY